MVKLWRTSSNKTNIYVITSNIILKVLDNKKDKKDIKENWNNGKLYNSLIFKYWSFIHKNSREFVGKLLKI